MSYVSELRALMGHRSLIIAGAAVLIFDKQNRLLLQHRRDNQQWGLIGGSMEIGESLEETAKREAFEETGLNLDELNWFGLFSGQELIYQYPHGDIIVNVVAVYISRQFTGKLKTNTAEGYGVRFFDLNQLPSNISPPDRPIIEKYFQNPNSQKTNMTNPTNIDETRIKTLFKEALVEVIEENQDKLSSIVIDALENIGLSRAIEEREKSQTVSRDEIFKALSGE